MKNIRVMYYFFLRDFQVVRPQFKRLLFNYFFMMPLSTLFSLGYIVPHVNMTGASPEQMTTFFLGVVLWMIFPIAYIMNLDLLFDIERDQFISYQMLVLHRKLIIIERLLFSALFSFIGGVVFLGYARLLLSNQLYFANISWMHVISILLVASLFCSSFSLFFFTYLPSSKKLGFFWSRVNSPLFFLGGVFIPWYVMNKFSLILGTISLAKPLTLEVAEQMIIHDRVF